MISLARFFWWEFTKYLSEYVYDTMERKDEKGKS